MEVLPMANAPVQKFTIGVVTANVWENKNGDRSFYTVDLQRRYKDGDEWKNATSLNTSDLLNAAKVLTRAESWIATQ